MAALKAGTAAPAFSLSSPPEQRGALFKFRDRAVILVFYPADWRPVCADQLPLYSQLRDEVAKLDAARLAISGGGVCWLLAFAQNRSYLLTLVADFEPEGEVTRRYEMYRDKNGFAQRALIVLDKDGVNQWSYVSPVGFNPGADGILSALEALPRGAP